MVFCPWHINKTNNRRMKNPASPPATICCPSGQTGTNKSERRAAIITGTGKGLGRNFKPDKVSFFSRPFGKLQSQRAAQSHLFPAAKRQIRGIPSCYKVTQPCPFPRQIHNALFHSDCSLRCRTWPEGYRFVGMPILGSSNQTRPPVHVSQQRKTSVSVDLGIPRNTHFAPLLTQPPPLHRLLCVSPQQPASGLTQS